MAKVLGKINPREKVHIVGAGASGLLIAFYLKKKQIPFVLYEKKRVGGLIESKKTNHGIVETAANALFTNDDVIDLLKDLNLSYMPARPKLRRLIAREKKFLSFPIYWFELPKIFFSFFFKKPTFKGGLSLKQFFTPLLGEKICDEVVSTGLQGIYASDASVIDQESFFPLKQYSSYWAAFKEFIQDRASSRIKYKKRESISFPGGMQEFIDALKKEVGSSIVYDDINELPSNSILCTNAHDAAKILEHVHPTVSTLLKKIEYRAMSTNTFFTKEEYLPLRAAFGVLFSRNTGFNSFGVLANHEIFPERKYPGFSYTFIKLSNSHDAQELEKDCQELKFPKIIDKYSSSWEKGIPVYSFSRRQIMDEISDYFDNMNVKNLALFGNYVDGISLRELISMAKKFSEQL